MYDGELEIFRSSDFVRYMNQHHDYSVAHHQSNVNLASPVNKTKIEGY